MKSGFCAPAVDETVILLHHPLPLVGVSMVMERERQQNGRLENGLPDRTERRQEKQFGIKPCMAVIGPW